MLKDYYKILDITPHASAAEIKKSFRKLAMRYHPDKHPEDQVAAAHFREIQEAYEILQDPRLRDQYLQERWYAQSMGRKMRDSAPMTTHTILQDVIALERHLSVQDPHRTDQQGLADYLEFLFRDENLETLKIENDSSALNELRRLIINIVAYLDLEKTQALFQRLQGIYPDSLPENEILLRVLKSKAQSESWDRWKMPVFIGVALLICALIFFSARP